MNNEDKNLRNSLNKKLKENVNFLALNYDELENGEGFGIDS